MRNGNTKQTKSHMLISSSYRTYEEWKPNFANDNKCSNIVLTVPMRNGNPFTIPSKLSGYSVLTVPMRNGNEMLKNYDCKPSEFLPYL